VRANDTPASTLGTLDRGLAVLEHLARRGDARLAELAREFGSSRTTMFRVMETLRARGFVEHLTASHTYRLGPMARVLAASAVLSVLARLAEAPMAQLRNQTGETVNLIRVQGARLFYEAVYEGQYSLRSLPAVGQPVGVHCSALGKSVLADSAGPMRDLLLGPEPYPKLTEATITARADMENELQATRERGYAVDNEENETGLTCVAAAIRGPDGRPSGAISISGLTERMHKLDLAELGQHVHDQCQAIAVRLRS
jgi:DNA-binding IclR family transcriptional regulator